MRWALPLLSGFLFLLIWEGAVYLYDIPIFVLPPPSAVIAVFGNEMQNLLRAAATTLRVTLLAFFWAVVSGIVMAIIFTRARWLEHMFYPYLVTLQVTPVIAIAPLILIWVGFENTNRALIIIAWLIAFFPMLANTILGIRSTDPALHDLMTLAKAKNWQRLYYVELPSALPHIFAGAKISIGLALIGAVVAEFVAGSGTSTGLAWRIIEAGNRLQINVVFASLILLAILGVSLFYSVRGLEYIILRHWHDSHHKIH